jgi:succinoglycan biosynthesis protein ExoM
LKQLLAGLLHQKTDGLFTYSIVVADNDASESAKGLVEDFAYSNSLKITYCVEPRRNISLVRNLALTRADGDFIAFIDDDELPVKAWLLALFKTCIDRNVDGTLGPVVPHFDDEPPAWVRRGRFFDRPRHKTGFIIDWTEGRTGNLLFRQELLNGKSEAFRAEFGSGGEDRDLFRRWIAAGRRFAWCDEAIAYESVPIIRWKRSFLIRRALLRGKMSLHDSDSQIANLFRSFLAVPAYVVALPFFCLFGHHIFMKYLVSLFDHIGRLVAWLGFEPVKETYVIE